MKKILIIAALISVSWSARSQDWRNEIALSYGQLSVGEFVYVLGGVFTGVFSLGHVTMENPRFTGVVSLEYYHSLSKVFSVGGIIAAESIWGNMISTSKEPDDPDRINGRYDMMFLSVMPAVRARWFGKPRFSMYSKVAVGLCACFNGETSFLPGVQLSPICLEFGNPSIRGFLEIGAGMQGVVNLGIRHRF